MPRRVEVLDNDVETRRPGPPPRTSGSWTWLLVGLAIGIGVGLLSIGLSPNSQPQTSDEGTTPDLAAPSEGEPALDIGALLPEVLGIEVLADGGLQQIVGPVTGPFANQPLPAVSRSGVALDHSGRWLAMTSEMPDGQQVLMMGRLPRLAPISTDARSFAWHDSRPRVISYIENAGAGEHSLKIVEDGADPQLIAEGEQLDGDMVGWGDWGWALQRSDSSVAILDTAGNLAEMIGGLALDSHGTGWIVTVTEGGLLHIVVPGGGTVWIDIDYEAIGGVGVASLSPDRKKIALAGPVGVKVTALNRDDDSLTVRYGSLPKAVSWSPDSRFVILSRRNGVMILDTWATDGQRAVYEVGGRSWLALSVIR